MPQFSPPASSSLTAPRNGRSGNRFSRFRLATKLNKDDGEIQVSSLIYAIGSEAEKIFSSFVFTTEDQKKDYELILKFDEYFIPRRNVIHERACFYQLTQQAEHLRDHLVVGMKDKKLSRRFQLMVDLTLAQVIEQVRQAEEITKQVSLQASLPETRPADVDFVRCRNNCQKKQSWQQRGDTA